MSDANAIGMNTGYPQSGIRTGAYATPDQQPISRDMLPYPGQPQFAEGGEVDSYTYDPVTQMYVKKSGEGATMVSPKGGISGASGSSDGDQISGPNKNTLNETFEEQSARNQKFNDFATSLSKMGLTGMLMSGINSVFGAPNNYAPVSDAGTSVVGRSMQDMQDAYNADMSAAQAQSISDQSNAGASPSDNSPAGGFGEGQYAYGGLTALAQGGISNLGDYSDGGRLLRGPGDGISDSIPAMIGKKQPARLADGEFVVPARIVSELGNGSTEAGARKLYAMMDRVQKARGKTVGKGKVAANSRSAKYLPA